MAKYEYILVPIVPGVVELLGFSEQGVSERLNHVQAYDIIETLIMLAGPVEG